MRHWAAQPGNSDLLARLGRAHLIVLSREIRWEPGLYAYTVQASDPEELWYEVDLDEQACTCPDRPRAPRGWCKHLLAVALMGAAQTLQQRKLNAVGEQLPDSLSYAAIQWQRLQDGQAVCQDHPLAEAVA